eukprot:3007123-Lingulodinium_polyedra.AAC.1
MGTTGHEVSDILASKRPVQVAFVDPSASLTCAPSVAVARVWQVHELREQPHSYSTCLLYTSPSPRDA